MPAQQRSMNDEVHMSQDTSSSTTTASAGSGQSGQAGQQGDAFENLLHETRTFPPTPEFAADAVVKASEYEEAAADRPAFWAKQARELLTWSKDFDQALDWSNPGPACGGRPR
jgi:acetyl-CoA synthetase